MLHISAEEQRERLQERLDDPAKHWKFSMSDIEARKQWSEYQKAYEMPAGGHAHALGAMDHRASQLQDTPQPDDRHTGARSAERAAGATPHGDSALEHFTVEGDRGQDAPGQSPPPPAGWWRQWLGHPAWPQCSQKRSPAHRAVALGAGRCSGRYRRGCWCGAAATAVVGATGAAGVASGGLLCRRAGSGVFCVAAVAAAAAAAPGPFFLQVGHLLFMSCRKLFIGRGECCPDRPFQKTRTR